MQNNKKKFKLSTFFLIICIIALIVMGFLVNKYYNEKNVEAKKVAELQSQLSIVNSSLNDVQASLNRMSATVQAQLDEKKAEAEEESKDDETKEYTYSNLKGSYKSVAEGKDYTLDLYENGTFKYSYSNQADIPVGQIGNYTIVDDSIMLHYWFSTGSSAQLTATTGEKTLKINNEGAIIDSSSGTMTKLSSSEADYNVNTMIQNYAIVNKINR